jgi:hypothetical protein
MGSPCSAVRCPSFLGKSVAADPEEVEAENGSRSFLDTSEGRGPSLQNLEEAVAEKNQIAPISVER